MNKTIEPQDVISDLCIRTIYSNDRGCPGGNELGEYYRNKIVDGRTKLRMIFNRSDKENLVKDEEFNRITAEGGLVQTFENGELIIDRLALFEYIVKYSRINRIKFNVCEMSGLEVLLLHAACGER